MRYIYKTYFYAYILINMSIYINIYKPANDSSRMSQVKFIQVELTSFIRVGSSLYEYVSFNIQAYYYVHEWLIYYSSRYRIEFNRAKPSRIHEQPWAHLTHLMRCVLSKKKRKEEHEKSRREET
jgi:hypothetical protein